MSVLGSHLHLRIGPTVPFPAPPLLSEQLEQVSVTHNETGRSGFQLSFAVGRNRALGSLDYPPLFAQLLRLGHRVKLYVSLAAEPVMLMDGIITSLQLAPSAELSGSKLTVLGEDVSVMMDVEARQNTYEQLTDAEVVTKILSSYMMYGVEPDVQRATWDRRQLRDDGPKQRNGTDYEILNRIADDYNYVFYLDPLARLDVNRAYMGQPERAALPQRALTFGMGPASNVTSLQLGASGTKQRFVTGTVQPPRATPQGPLLPAAPVFGVPVAQPPLAALPMAFASGLLTGSRLLSDDFQGDMGRAYARAASDAEASTRDAVTGSGELDVARYGGILRPRAVVELRGVGLTFDGAWYVKSVSHNISRGSYRQQFSIQRDGFLPLSPTVRA